MQRRRRHPTSEVDESAQNALLARAAHRALVSLSARLYAKVEGARFEPRSDLIVAVCPGLPLPGFNGVWVEEDSAVAVGALPAAIAEVEAAGERPWVQCRSGQERTQAAARELGFTYAERSPGMVARPHELIEVGASLEIARMTGDELDQTLDVLAAAFEAQRELFERLAAPMLEFPEARWYVGRSDGRIVSTALGVTTDEAAAIFNVATLPDYARRGYGAALTAQAARDGFAGGAELACLQSSPIGHGVYRRLGFRDVEEYVLLARP